MRILRYHGKPRGANELQIIDIVAEENDTLVSRGGTRKTLCQVGIHIALFVAAITAVLQVELVSASPDHWVRLAGKDERFNLEACCLDTDPQHIDRQPVSTIAANGLACILVDQNGVVGEYTIEVKDDRVQRFQGWPTTFGERTVRHEQSLVHPAGWRVSRTLRAE